MSRIARLGLIVAVVCLIADQVTKLYILNLLSGLAPPQRIEVLSFADLVIVWNRGVSFGLLDQGGSSLRWILVAVALAISAGLTVWLLRLDRKVPAFAIGLILGGAIGNVVDRIRFGAVFDFVYLHARGYAWPAFNVADSTITIGVIVLLFDSLFGGRESSK